MHQTDIEIVSNLCNGSLPTSVVNYFIVHITNTHKYLNNPFLTTMVMVL